MKTPFNPVLTAQPPTIFDVMSTLARELGAVNLGQGFPDRDGAPDVRAFAAKSLMEDSNQYPPSPGLPELRLLWPTTTAGSRGWIWTECARWWSRPAPPRP